jgi:hypothetical protein
VSPPLVWHAYPRPLQDAPAEAEVRLALPGNLSCGALALEHCKDHRMFDVARGTVSLEATG